MCSTIQAGKEADARAFAAETFGARRTDFEAHLERVGITRETWSLQETPMGSLMVVWFECGDVEKVFAPPTTPSTRSGSGVGSSITTWPHRLKVRCRRFSSTAAPERERGALAGAPSQCWYVETT